MSSKLVGRINLKRGNTSDWAASKVILPQNARSDMGDTVKFLSAHDAYGIEGGLSNSITNGVVCWYTYNEDGPVFPPGIYTLDAVSMPQDGVKMYVVPHEDIRTHLENPANENKLQNYIDVQARAFCVEHIASRRLLIVPDTIEGYDLVCVAEKSMTSGTYVVCTIIAHSVETLSPGQPGIEYTSNGPMLKVGAKDETLPWEEIPYVRAYGAFKNNVSVEYPEVDDGKIDITPSGISCTDSRGQSVFSLSHTPGANKGTATLSLAGLNITNNGTFVRVNSNLKCRYKLSLMQASSDTTFDITHSRLTSADNLHVPGGAALTDGQILQFSNWLRIVDCSTHCFLTPKAEMMNIYLGAPSRSFKYGYIDNLVTANIQATTMNLNGTMNAYGLAQFSSDIYMNSVASCLYTTLLRARKFPASDCQHAEIKLYENEIRTDADKSAHHADRHLFTFKERLLGAPDDGFNVAYAYSNEVHNTVAYMDKYSASTVTSLGAIRRPWDESYIRAIFMPTFHSESTQNLGNSMDPSVAVNKGNIRGAYIRLLEDDTGLKRCPDSGNDRTVDGIGIQIGFANDSRGTQLQTLANHTAKQLPSINIELTDEWTAGSRNVLVIPGSTQASCIGGGIDDVKHAVYLGYHALDDVIFATKSSNDATFKEQQRQFYRDFIRNIYTYYVAVGKSLYAYRPYKGTGSNRKWTQIGENEINIGSSTEPFSAVYCLKTITNTSFTASDKRAKTDIVYIDGKKPRVNRGQIVEFIKNLKPATFRLKPPAWEEDTGAKSEYDYQLGFIAQDMQSNDSKVFNAIGTVHEVEPTQVYKDGKQYTLQDLAMAALSLVGLQEMMKENEMLKARLDAIEKKLASL